MPPDGATSRLWDRQLLANPHAVGDKRARVQRMFAAIAPSYDLNNRLHSLWLDQRWRRTAVQLAQVKPTDTVVDVACGTGDLALAFASAGAERVIGVDFTFAMLPFARDKARAKSVISNLKSEISNLKSEIPDLKSEISNPRSHPACRFIAGDAIHLPLADSSADIVSIAFGIRNVAAPAAALSEFHRILRPGGRLVILEFSLPENPLLRGLYNFYFRRILPHTATWISGDRTGAYRYLPESVNTFIGREQMLTMMRQAGFADVRQHPLTFGVCVCYRGGKS